MTQKTVATHSPADSISPDGNLRMNHVSLLFNRLLQDHAPDTNDLGRKYGRVSWWYSGKTEDSAANIKKNNELVQEIKNFVNGEEPKPEDIDPKSSKDFSIGTNRTLILLQVDELITVYDRKGNAIEQPNFENTNSTHYTVLNLRKDEDDKISIRYSNSLGSPQKRDRIPDNIFAILQAKGIDPDTAQQDFSSTKQGATANCGYCVVFNALTTLDIQPPQSEIEDFIEVQREFLKKELEKQMSPETPAQKSNLSDMKKDEEVKQDSVSGGELPKKERKTMRRNPIIDADDSSDDEAVLEKVFGGYADESHTTRQGGYDLATQLENFTSDFYGSKTKPLIAHAFGVGLLYSQSVEEKYHTPQNEGIGLKEKYLSDSRRKIKPQEILEKNLEKVVNDITGFFIFAISKEKQDNILSDINQYMSSHQNQTDVEAYFKLAAEKLAEMVFEMVDHEELAFTIVDKSKLQELQKSQDYYLSNKGVYTKCSELNYKLQNDGNWKLSQNQTLNLDGHLYSMKKVGKKWNVNSKTDNKRFHKRGTNYLSYHENKVQKEVSEGLFKNNLSFSTLLEDELIEKLVPLLKEAGLIEENKTESSATKSPHKIKVTPSQWGDHSVSRVAKKGLRNSVNALKNHLGAKKNFEPSIRENIAFKIAYFEDLKENKDLFKTFVNKYLFKESKLSRKTLPNRFATDDIADALDLMANIRLSNRSKTREIKNIKDANEREDFLGKDVLTRVKRSWRFDDGLFAEEEQTISSSNLARDAQVIVLNQRSEGAYASLYQTLSNDVIKKFNVKYPNHRINDKTIAQWVREKLAGEAFALEDELDIARLDVDKLNQFITDFTYLLFGCEVARNPASLVMHQMMLDLILSEKLTWAACLTEESPKMPMAMGGAVQAARRSHEDFKNYLPWAYKYEGEANAQQRDQLLSQENELFEQWLKHKNINPEFAQEALLIACKDWYGIDMRSVMYGITKQQGKIRNPAEHILEKFLSIINQDSFALKEGDYVLMQDIIGNYKTQVPDLLKEKLATSLDKLKKQEEQDLDTIAEKDSFLKCIDQYVSLDLKPSDSRPFRELRSTNSSLSDIFTSSDEEGQVDTPTKSKPSNQPSTSSQSLKQIDLWQAFAKMSTESATPKRNSVARDQVPTSYRDNDSDAITSSDGEDELLNTTNTETTQNLDETSTRPNSPALNNPLPELENLQIKNDRTPTKKIPKSPRTPIQKQKKSRGYTP